MPLLAALSEERKEETIVMDGTGGIRCEKAGPCLEKAGFKNVYQLAGGILKYFEECGAAYFEGECFVELAEEEKKRERQQAPKWLPHPLH